MFFLLQIVVPCCIVIFLILHAVTEIAEIRFWSSVLEALGKLLVKKKTVYTLDKRIGGALIRKIISMGIIAGDCVGLIMVLSAALKNHEPGDMLNLILRFGSYLSMSSLLLYGLRRYVDREKREEYARITGVTLTSGVP